jgi:hypothetical protein
VSRSWRSWSSFAALAALTACASGRAATAQDPGDPIDLPPAGFGTLRQDQIGIRLQTQGVAIRVLPLDERVIRLLAPDAYRSLTELRDSRAAEISAQARAAGRDSAALLIVTFFALQPEARFNPDEIYITAQNEFYRPIAVVPLTARWSENVVAQRQQAAAIYLFEPTLPVLRPFTTSYGGISTAAWEASLRLLDAERGRAIARARQAGPGPE